MRCPPRSRAEYGGTKLLNLFWLALLLTAVYFGVMYVPVWTEQWDVKSMLQDVGNSNWRHLDEDVVRQAIAKRCQEFNKDGKDYFQLDTENIVVDNDETAKQLTLRISWTRVIPYPFLQKQTQKIFTQQYQVDTNPVSWK